MNTRDEYARVVADHLAHDLVHLPGVGLGLQGVPKLGLENGELRLDIAPLVVARQERVPLVGKQVVKPLALPFLSDRFSIVS